MEKRTLCKWLTPWLCLLLLATLFAGMGGIRALAEGTAEVTFYVR